MSLRRSALALLCAFCCVVAVSVTARHAEAAAPIDPMQSWGQIKLLQGFSSKSSIQIKNSPQETVIDYLKPLYEFAIEVGIGIATLWVLVSGTAIILVGGDASKRAQWIHRCMVSIAGLVLLILWGVVLRFLNAHFFV